MPTFFRRRVPTSAAAGLLLARASSGYVAEDAPARHATVAQVGQLAWDEPRGAASCGGTVLMIDDRRVDAAANLSLAKHPYYNKAFALNRLYATRHNLSFVLVRPTAGEWLAGQPRSPACAAQKGDFCAGMCPAWCRLKIIRRVVAQLLARPRPEPAGAACHWLLYIDSDAYVREQHTDFTSVLGAPRHADVHLAIAREEPPAGAFRSNRRRAHGVRVPSLNAGVLFVRASAWSEALLDVWMRAPELPVCEPFRRSWPCEQQCLHELLRNRTLLPDGWQRRIATAPTQLFNSPWGSFVRHVWGGPGAELRRRAFDDELRVQGVWRRRAFERLLGEAHAAWVDMPC